MHLVFKDKVQQFCTDLNYTAAIMIIEFNRSASCFLCAEKSLQPSTN